MKPVVKLASLVLSAVLLTALLSLSVRGIIDPGAAAASFGVPVTEPSAELYQSVYRSRNLTIAATGIFFLFGGMWRALAILTSAAIALPLFDIAILKMSGVAVTAVHPATLVALVIVAAILWLRVGYEAFDKPLRR